MSNTKHQSGMTLIEASVWFVLFALVIAGALKMYSSVSSSQIVSALTTDVIAIRSGTQSLYAKTAGGYGSSVSLQKPLVIAGKLPADVIPDSSYNLTNKQQGWVMINAINPSLFTIDEMGLDRSVCIGVALNMVQQGFVFIVVNSTTYNPASLFTPAVAATKCSGSNNTVEVWSH